MTKALRPLKSRSRAQARRQWMKRNQVWPSSGFVSPMSLVYPDAEGATILFESPRFPWDDHGELWDGAGDLSIYTAQPYDFDGEKLASLASFIAAFGLECRIGPDGWWNPKDCVLIEIVRTRPRPPVVKEMDPT